jgi:xanthine/uracil permease
VSKWPANSTVLPAPTTSLKRCQQNADCGHTMELEKRSTPRLWIMLSIGLPLALAYVLVWVLIAFGCPAYENLEGNHARMCNHSDPQPRIWLPILGAVVVLASIYLARRARRVWIFGLGVLIAVASGLYLYALATS